MKLWHLLTTLLIGYPLPSEMIDPRFPVFLQRAGGMSLTLLITVISLCFGAAIGTPLALSRRETAADPRLKILQRLFMRALNFASAAIVEGIRGLPIMLLILLTFHLPYRLAGVRVPAVILAIAAFSLYAAVYFSEIMRSGLRSVDPGLRNVGRVLGLTSRQILWRIEMPLVFRTMKPDLINLAVTVFKDTSTLAVVAVAELTYVGRQMLTSEPINYELLLFLTLLLYWVPASILTALAFRAGRSGLTQSLR